VPQASGSESFFLQEPVPKKDTKIKKLRALNVKKGTVFIINGFGY
jgi:hypothetical protein